MIAIPCIALHLVYYIGWRGGSGNGRCKTAGTKCCEADEEQRVSDERRGLGRGSEKNCNNGKSKELTHHIPLASVPTSGFCSGPLLAAI